jgi:16S rRNA (guanine966-N2)-methyltransferase
LRIISGKYKGKRLNPPINLKARPTTDFAKEGLFNILHNNFDFSELKILDLFSGTGCIGFEFASRGANFVEMIEKNFVHHNFIKNTIIEMKMENARVIKTDVFIYIHHIHQVFDLIFADPPFNLEGIEEFPDKIFSSGILKSHGWFILEHPKNITFSSHPNCFDERAYGGVHFSFFKSFNDLGIKQKPGTF